MEGLYAVQGRIHAALARVAREARGQGTVEYVGLILLVAVILAGVVKASGRSTRSAKGSRRGRASRDGPRWLGRRR